MLEITPWNRRPDIAVSPIAAAITPSWIRIVARGCLAAGNAEPYSGTSRMEISARIATSTGNIKSVAIVTASNRRYSASIPRQISQSAAMNCSDHGHGLTRKADSRDL